MDASSPWLQLRVSLGFSEDTALDLELSTLGSTLESESFWSPHQLPLLSPEITACPSGQTSHLIQRLSLEVPESYWLFRPSSSGGQIIPEDIQALAASTAPGTVGATAALASKPGLTGSRDGEKRIGEKWQVESGPVGGHLNSHRLEHQYGIPIEWWTQQKWPGLSLPADMPLKRDGPAGKFTNGKLGDRPSSYGISGAQGHLFSSPGRPKEMAPGPWPAAQGRSGSRGSQAMLGNLKKTFPNISKLMGLISQRSLCHSFNEYLLHLRYMHVAALTLGVRRGGSLVLTVEVYLLDFGNLTGDVLLCVFLPSWLTTTLTPFRPLELSFHKSSPCLLLGAPYKTCLCAIPESPSFITSTCRYPVSLQRSLDVRLFPSDSSHAFYHFVLHFYPGSPGLLQRPGWGEAGCRGGAAARAEPCERAPRTPAPRDRPLPARARARAVAGLRRALSGAVDWEGGAGGASGERAAELPVHATGLALARAAGGGARPSGAPPRGRDLGAEGRLVILASESGASVR
ncbi:Ribosome Production Factor 1 [Manis pentadactyla]|nr:Ribosome Production Factor 1 [Manis pentadactyla]